MSAEECLLEADFTAYFATLGDGLIVLQSV